MPLKRAKPLQRLKVLNLLNLYNTSQSDNGYTFINQNGDEYLVYMTEYYLLNPDSVNPEDMVSVNHIGFSCKRGSHKVRFDERTKNTIIATFLSFFEERPDDAFVFICDNRDNKARNRRITFDGWIKQANAKNEYYVVSAHLKNIHFYASIIVKGENLLKDFYVGAFNYTVEELI